MHEFFEKHLKRLGVVTVLRDGKPIGKIARHGGGRTGWPATWVVSVPGILAPGMGGWKARGSASFPTYAEARAALTARAEAR